MVPGPKVIRASLTVSLNLEHVGANYAAALRSNDRRAIDKLLDLLEEAARVGAQLPSVAIERELDPLRTIIEARGPAPEAAKIAEDLATRVLEQHNVLIAPLAPPQWDRAASLFRENCAKCHGDGGGGDGKEAAELKSKPRSFLDPAVMDDMSPRRVFTTLTVGFKDSEMPRFDLLSVGDRWSLAFYVMALRYAEAPSISSAAAALDLETLANLRDRQLRAPLGESAERVATARVSGAFQASAGPIARAQEALALAVDDHRAGRRAEAAARLDAVLSDSFSAYRAALTTRATTLVFRIERRLRELREEIPGGASPVLEQSALLLKRDLGAAASIASTLHPLAIGGAATLALFGWIAILLMIASVAGRAAGMSHGDRAIYLGAAVALCAGVATLLFAKDDAALIAASSRHQVVALLRIVAMFGALSAVVVLARRLAIASERPAPSPGPLPWWLAGVCFVGSYGAVLEWSHALRHIGAETATPAWQLAGVGLVVAAALIASAWVLMSVVRRQGRAASFAIGAALAMVCAIALAGSAMRGLTDGGSMPAIALGTIRADTLAVHPFRWVAAAQLGCGALGIIIFAWALVARRAAEPR